MEGKQGDFLHAGDTRQRQQAGPELLTKRRAPARVTVALCGTVLLSACGGSGSAVLTTPNGAATSSTPAPGSTGPADPETAQSLVMANWTKFWNYKTPRDQKIALLENGDQLGPAVDFAAKQQEKQQLKEQVRVDRVKFVSPTHATVFYALLNDTTVLLPTASGVAVLVGDTWKVSDRTFCVLVSLANGANPAPSCPS
jgi:hypothetical protein